MWFGHWTEFCRFWHASSRCNKSLQCSHPVCVRWACWSSSSSLQMAHIWFPVFSVTDCDFFSQYVQPTYTLESQVTNNHRKKTILILWHFIKNQSIIQQLNWGFSNLSGPICYVKDIGKKLDWGYYRLLDIKYKVGRCQSRVLAWEEFICPLIKVPNLIKSSPVGDLTESFLTPSGKCENYIHLWKGKKGQKELWDFYNNNNKKIYIRSISTSSVRQKKKSVIT